MKVTNCILGEVGWHCHNILTNMIELSTRMEEQNKAPTRNKRRYLYNRSNRYKGNETKHQPRNVNQTDYASTAFAMCVMNSFPPHYCPTAAKLSEYNLLMEAAFSHRYTTHRTMQCTFNWRRIQNLGRQISFQHHNNSIRSRLDHSPSLLQRAQEAQALSDGHPPCSPARPTTVSPWPV